VKNMDFTRASVQCIKALPSRPAWVIGRVLGRARPGIVIPQLRGPDPFPESSAATLRLLESLDSFPRDAESRRRPEVTVAAPSYRRQCIAVTWLIYALIAPLLGSAASQKSPEAFTRTLILVRHGAYAGHSDSPDGPSITPLGVAQAHLVGERLRSLPTSITSITTSTMTRARQTATVIQESLRGVPLRESRLIRECMPPLSGEERPGADTDGEAKLCQATLDEAFHEYFVPARGAAQQDVLVCHGNVIRYFVTKALGVDTKAWLGMAVAHASITVIKTRADGTMTVLSVGDVGHIPPSLQSWGDRRDPQLLAPK
jgi:serine/threonine-protein phosphatase PGAM5